MRALVQRVLRAEVSSREVGPWTSVGSIGPGLCVFVGVTHTDTEPIADKMANKIWGLRVLNDADGVMNRSLSDLAAQEQPSSEAPTGEPPAARPAVLVVSQFTLYGETGKGRRPSWINAARPEQAEALVDRVAARLGELGAELATGRFRSDMRVELVNNGPCTLMLEIE